MLLFDKILTFNSKEGYIDTNNPESDPIITKKREIKALEPSQTLYVNNLNEKIKKDGKFVFKVFINSIFLEMKHSLFHLFSIHGDILEITVKRNLKMKGQAFIVFSNIENSMKAMQEYQNYTFFGKKMRIQFAQKASDTVLKAKGEFDKFAIRKRMQNKRIEEAKLREENREAMQEKLKEVKGDIYSMKNKLEQSMEERKEIIASMNTTITVENLPDTANEQMVRDLFSKFPGIINVFINEATHVAIIEYETSQQAKNAKDGRSNSIFYSHLYRTGRISCF